MSVPSKKASGNSIVSSYRQNFESLTVNTKSSVASTGSPSPSIRAKTELTSKNNEIKRLEALCETRTKELSMERIKLKDTLVSFDAIAVAYNFLANDVSSLMIEISSIPNFHFILFIHVFTVEWIRSCST